MKESTILHLEEEIKSGKYSYDFLNSPRVLEFFTCNGTLRRLFEIYLEEEIDDVDTFFNMFIDKSGKDIEFYDFIMSHIDDFKISKDFLEDMGVTAEEILSHDAVMASRRVIGSLPKGFVRSKQKFVDMAKGVVRKGRFLEVGSGTDVPVSSLLLAKELGGITSMDKFHNHWSSLDFFKKLKVNAVDGFFNNETCINDYDVIVGQHPCEAIIPVVERLGNSDERDYFIEVCDCSAPSGGMKEFLLYLRSKDKRLQSIHIIKNELTRKQEYYLNGLPQMKYYDTLYITNSSMDGDDLLSKIVEEDTRTR